MGLLSALGLTQPYAGMNAGAQVTIGLDVGQRVDPTALCVAETEQRVLDWHWERGSSAEAEPRKVERTEAHFVIRHLERLPLGTPYPAVARRVRDVAAQVVLRTQEEPTLFMDATGVGQPLADVLEAEQVPARLICCYFTHGDRRTEEREEVKLGKAWLVSRLQILLQSGRIHLPKMREAEALARELLDYEIKIDQNANDTYGAFKVGTHDDLVTALGLAVQVEPSAGGIWWL